MTVEGESVFTGNSAAFDGGEGDEQVWCGPMYTENNLVPKCSKFV